MGKEGRERQVLHWALFFFRVLVTGEKRFAHCPDGLGVLGVLVRTCTTLVEWLLKGRMWSGWVGLPKDAKKPIRGEVQMGRVARIS